MERWHDKQHIKEKQKREMKRQMKRKPLLFNFFQYHCLHWPQYICHLSGFIDLECFSVRIVAIFFVCRLQFTLALKLCCEHSTNVTGPSFSQAIFFNLQWIKHEVLSHRWSCCLLRSHITIFIISLLLLFSPHCIVPFSFIASHSFGVSILFDNCHWTFWHIGNYMPATRIPWYSFIFNYIETIMRYSCQFFLLEKVI